MAPRATRRATASAARTRSSAAEDEGAKSKPEVQEANPHIEHGEDVDDGSSKKKPATTEAKDRPQPTTPALLPPSLNLSSSTSIKFTAFTVSSGKSSKKETACLRSHRAPHSTSLIFTHGAGGDLSAAAMVNFSQGFAATGLGVVMFQGNMNVQARAGLFGLVKEYERENGSLAGTDDDTGTKRKMTEARENSVAYGGRSMGARAAVIASHIDPSVKALVLASYPLISPAGDIRDKILLDISADVDVLFISGDNDSMCPLARLQTVRDKMRARTWRVVVKGADHGMNIRGGKKLKDGTERLGKECGRVAARWLRERDEDKREMTISWDGEKGRLIGGGVWIGEGTGTTTQGNARKGAKKEEGDHPVDEEGGDDEAEQVGTKRRRTKK
ncbi:uncharacterized protein Z520_05005 [Fonsecaea multimorphosa CBS 102226]|uniref:KANL3/Tex30 alpha/beta hydrolase-like domain-containing protein n=1 Tax=Fonsecaea multimorphosa CBS 102226 TaxID=1442371 RepID=A0A0D2K8H4_9EURO|nr:uncharacterized protein Z520_05005 [Fonsecaea multimorphosa CBS 102226]KIX99429.1 hypothetical protein Z520_05005 [Fonsecaea multimorphosa CBS 102226]OAL25756.1 hypothetical protein AYO22_04745 [Fonsecaea multimorphosa]